MTCNDALERGSTSVHWRSTAMAMSLVEAAAATGVNRSTLFRAYKSGRMTATRTDAGTIEVDAAELFRCFPPQQGALGAMHQRAPTSATDENASRVSALEAEVRLLREMLDAMREDRAAWREQAGKVVAALPPPFPALEPRKPWWRRLVG
jgi:hypothetical protein